jgi:predicted phosphodiesterase
MDKDKIIHVGDLIAKGERNLEVLDWMIEFQVQGVRGNHDQPVSLLSPRSIGQYLILGYSVEDMDGVGRRI